MNNTFKGTKGKWHVYHNSQGYNSFNINSKYKTVSREEEYANALLISKAPEMLEMLKDIVEQENVSQSAHDEIYKLIKEATEV